MSWTEQQTEQLRELAKHYTVREIAEITGRTKASIYNKCNQSELRYQTGKSSADDRELARALRKDGMSLREIAEKFEVCEKSVLNWTRGIKIKPAHIVESDKRRNQAIKLFNQGKTAIRIAVELGVSQSSVYRMLGGFKKCLK